jgi:hypothetical protein
MPFSFSKPSKRVRHTQNALPAFRDGQVINSIHLPTSNKARTQALQAVSSSMMLPGGVKLLRMKGKSMVEPSTSNLAAPPGELDPEDANDWEDFPGDDTAAFQIQEHQFIHTDSSRLLAQERAKILREKRQRRWLDEVLPRLLPRYLKYLAARHQVDPGHSVCPPAQCLCEERRALNVTILRWNGMFNTEMPALTNEILF